MWVEIQGTLHTYATGVHISNGPGKGHSLCLGCSSSYTAMSGSFHNSCLAEVSSAQRRLDLTKRLLLPPVGVPGDL